ncbi:MAG TPA: hypothetical protein VL221_11955 [Bacteroidota bacterium]|nr:hypothetical protein [Bacteroidota bacterium]
MTAVATFVGICLLLAVLLLFSLIPLLVSGLIFAVSLAVLGAASRGFRK